MPLSDIEQAIARRYILRAADDQDRLDRQRSVADLFDVSTAAIRGLMQKRNQGTVSIPRVLTPELKERIRTFVENASEDEQPQRRKIAVDVFRANTEQISAITAWTKIWAAKVLKEKKKKRSAT